ncbi:hypothetical protein BGZ65_011956 [Modicella reniformis]|uniref:Single-stranded DNA-binding protein n=1 Tax=Modicella reniformis TaxID=1440133 RepID=A0A9P6SUK4_9FUNG|nr:hypothetical protein BGZ65_011956 [Modicella reniformis]
MLLTTVSPLAKRVVTPAFGSVRTLVNKVSILGHVGQDAEINGMPERTRVSFSVATSTTRKDAEGVFHQTTQWHRIISWNQKKNGYLAERVKKGDLVYVEGPIQYNTYTGKDGIERQSTEIHLSTSVEQIQQFPVRVNERE